MQTFIDKIFKPVFIIGGIGTAVANLDAFIVLYSILYFWSLREGR